MEPTQGGASLTLGLGTEPLRGAEYPRPFVAGRGDRSGDFSLGGGGPTERINPPLRRAGCWSAWPESAAISLFGVRKPCLRLLLTKPRFVVLARLMQASTTAPFLHFALTPLLPLPTLQTMPGANGESHHRLFDAGSQTDMSLKSASFSSLLAALFLISCSQRFENSGEGTFTYTGPCIDRRSESS